MKTKKIYLVVSHKGIYIHAFKKLKTKLIPSPFPFPFNKLIIKMFSKKENKKFDFKNIKSVLIRPGAGVGDAVVMTAIINQLKKAYKEIKIGVIYNNRDEAIFKNNPIVNVAFKHNFFNYLKNRKKWDVFIDILPYFNEQNIIYDAILSPKYTIVTDKREDNYYFKKNFKNYDYYSSINKSKHMNQILENTPFYDYIDKDEKRKYFVYVDEKLYSQMDKIWEKGKIKILLNTAGNSWGINPNAFKTLVSEIHARFGDKVDMLLLNNKSNEKHFNLEELKVSEKLDPYEYIALVKTSDIIITPDTSLVHLAGAFEKYALTFYAPYIGKELWLPLDTDKQKIILSDKYSDIQDIEFFDKNKVLAYLKDFIYKLNK